MAQTEIIPIDLKVLMNHIYEYKKGVRRMILFTMNKALRAVCHTTAGAAEHPVCAATGW